MCHCKPPDIPLKLTLTWETLKPLKTPLKYPWTLLENSGNLQKTLKRLETPCNASKRFSKLTWEFKHLKSHLEWSWKHLKSFTWESPKSPKIYLKSTEVLWYSSEMPWSLLKLPCNFLGTNFSWTLLQAWHPFRINLFHLGKHSIRVPLTHYLNRGPSVSMDIADKHSLEQFWDFKDFWVSF